jgi:drug/metabolite transporter (DMT)-like permease
MSGSSRIAAAQKPLSAMAVALMVMLCLSWGFNQVSVKVALPDIPPLIQATLRSGGALFVVLAAARFRRVPMFERDGTLWSGIFAGVLFAIEFVLIYRGLVLTSASRAVVFLYSAPFVVALGSRFLLGERLNPSQWLGLAISFGGLGLAVGAPQASVTWSVILGDVMLLAAGAFWAFTTLIAKASRLRDAAPEKTLAYQLAVSVPILGISAMLFGERITEAPRLIPIISMIYQTFWVVGITFLIWFFLIKAYSASKLSSFTFMTPLFGVLSGYLILNDPITLPFAGAALLVIFGLWLVNRPQPA